VHNFGAKFSESLGSRKGSRGRFSKPQGLNNEDIKFMKFFRNYRTQHFLGKQQIFKIQSLS